MPIFKIMWPGECMETIKILASRGSFYAPPGKVNRVRRPASNAPASAPNKQERARGCLNRSDGFLQPCTGNDLEAPDMRWHHKVVLISEGEIK